VAVSGQIVDKPGSFLSEETDHISITPERFGLHFPEALDFFRSFDLTFDPFSSFFGYTSKGIFSFHVNQYTQMVSMSTKYFPLAQK
ncbi:MAG: hypothetical protein KJO26_02485, partial [Deltaproteobacteria bacterium]|nr:hypothetical protein [Deltaproteobacteria bacterium]